MKRIGGLRWIYVAGVMLGILGILVFLAGASERFFTKSWNANESIYEMCMGCGMVVIGIFAIISLRFFLDNVWLSLYLRIWAARYKKHSRERRRARRQKRAVEKKLRRDSS